MNKARMLFIVAGVALVVWLVSIGLYAQITSYDPYEWAVAGEASVVSRGLYLARRNLYVNIGVAAFATAVLTGAGGVLARRRSRWK